MRLFFTAILLFVGFLAGQAQTTLYVDSSVSASGGGTSWTTAYKTLGEALNVANAATNTVAYEVYIAKGTYYPTGVQSATARDSSFLFLRGGLRVYGGYPSGGGLRNIAGNPTILSGAIGAAADSTDNSYHIVVVANVANSGTTIDSTILDGVSIVRGAATGTGFKTYNSNSVSHANGAGVSLHAVGTKTLLRNCRFLNNYGTGNAGAIYAISSTLPGVESSEFAGNTAGVNGGALYLLGSSCRIAGCSFTNNRAKSGGAIYHSNSNFTLELTKSSFTANSTLVAGGGAGGAVAISNTSSTPFPAVTWNLDSLTFTANTAATQGGAIATLTTLNASITGSDYIRFRRCSFNSNSAASGGGALSLTGNPKWLVDTCTFFANKTVTGNGGAVLMGYGTFEITGTAFANDSATNSNGGALYSAIGSSSLTANTCTFTSNYSGATGGAVNSAGSYSDCTFDGNTALLNGGAIQGSSTLKRSRIRGNTAGTAGGGICAQTFGSITLENCLLSGNKASNGGAIALSSNSVSTITNCTLAGDTAANGNGIYLANSSTATFLNSIVWEGASNSLFTTVNSSIAATYSTIQGGFTGTGNASSDPAFAAPLSAAGAPTTAGNYALTACSPVRNTGSNSGAAGTVDLAGNPRIADQVVDQGAYEFQSAPLTGTLTGPSTICPGGATAQFTASVAGGTWSNPGPQLFTVSSTGLVTSNAGPGNALDTLVYTVLSGGCPLTTTKVITILAPPTVGTINVGTAQVCAGKTLTLSASPSGGAWAVSAPTLATITGTTASAATLTGLSAGTVTASYTITSSAGCTNTATSAPITIKPLPVVGPITGGNSLCANSTLQLAGTPSGGSWSVLGTNGLFTVNATGLVTPNAVLNSSSDSVLYTVTVNGCVGIDTQSVTVYALPATGTLTGPSVLCLSKPSSYTSTVSGGAWSNANAVSGTISATGTYTPAALGTDTIRYTVTSATTGCAATQRKAIQTLGPVTKSMAATFCEIGSYSFGGQTLTTAGTYTHTFQTFYGCDSVVTLVYTDLAPDKTVTQSGRTLTAQDSLASYSWFRCEADGSVTAMNAFTRSFTPAQDGRYEVLLGRSGCFVRSTCYTVTTPSNPASVASVLPEGWNLAPNPTTGRVLLQTGTTVARSITVQDATGRRLAVLSPTAPATAVDLSGYAQGLYLLTVRDASGSTHTLRVQVVGGL